VSRPFPCWNRSILTEISLCHASSSQEIFRTETAGQAAGPRRALRARHGVCGGGEHHRGLRGRDLITGGGGGGGLFGIGGCLPPAAPLLAGAAALTGGSAPRRLHWRGRALARRRCPVAARSRGRLPPGIVPGARPLAASVRAWSQSPYLLFPALSNGRAVWVAVLVRLAGRGRTCCRRSMRFHALRNQLSQRSAGMLTSACK
jgi:hypothetical protein